MARIRHATETFVKDLISGVKQLIQANTNQINVLSTDRGYLTTKTLSSIDLNNVTENGKYKCETTCTNLPESILSILEVTKFNDVFILQKVIPHKSSGDVMYWRIKFNGVWKQWNSDATTTKTEILLPLNSDYTIRSGYDSYIRKSSNGLVTITVGINKIDSTAFSTTADTLFAVLPVGFRPKSNLHTIGESWGGTGHAPCDVYVGSDGVMTYTTYGKAPIAMSFSVSFYTS